MATPPFPPITISTTPSASTTSIISALQSNLFRVFGERDAALRAQAIKETYTDDIVWFEAPNNVIRGKEALGQRAVELLEKSPGWVFKDVGEASVVGDLGVLRWWFGPVEDAEERKGGVKGIDVVVVEGGKIKILWTGLEGV